MWFHHFSQLAVAATGVSGLQVSQILPDSPRSPGLPTRRDKGEEARGSPRQVDPTGSPVLQRSKNEAEVIGKPLENH
jgi:hypothetical protein